MLGGAARSLWPRVSARVGQLLQAAQTVVDCGLRKLHPPGKLAQVELRVLAAPAGHLAQRGRKALETAPKREPLGAGRLAEARADRLADVGGFEVEPAVHLSAHFAHHPHAL